MIRDLEREQPPEAGRFDVCIVGAGAAGIALAVELVALGKRVLMLEGGGPTVEERSQEPYRSEVVGLPHRGIHVGRFRAHGGTTTRWGGQILEYDEQDFARREWVVGSGWPIAKAALTECYQRALEIEGLGRAEMDDAALWRRVGIVQPGYAHLLPYVSRWCPEPNFAVLHRRVLEGEGVSVWLHANVVAMEMEGERVRGLRCRTLTGREASFAVERVVFCLGTIECSRFFLQPREGELPWNRSGLLGKHYQDHVDVNAARVRPRDEARFHGLFDNIFLNGFKYHPKVKMDAETEQQERTLRAGATMYFRSDVDEQIGAVKATAKKVLLGKLGEVGAAEMVTVARNLPLLARQGWRYKMQHRMWNPPNAEIFLRVHCEQEPESASSITLSEQRDALGMLRTQLDWRISDLEQRTIREFVRLAQREMAGFAEIEMDVELERGDPAFRQRCDDSNHHMGGMRMAETDERGVVDPNLRLFGTENCYVCSGAVFPTSGFSNPTHTVLALAVRLARRLAVE